MTAMTAIPLSIPRCSCTKQLAQTSPDPMRGLLGSFRYALLSAQDDTV